MAVKLSDLYQTSACEKQIPVILKDWRDGNKDNPIELNDEVPEFINGAKNPDFVSKPLTIWIIGSHACEMERFNNHIDNENEKNKNKVKTNDMKEKELLDRALLFCKAWNASEEFNEVNLKGLLKNAKHFLNQLYEAHYDSSNFLSVKAKS